MEANTNVPPDQQSDKMEICEEHPFTPQPFVKEEKDDVHVEKPLQPSHPLTDVRRCAQCGTTQTPQWRNGPRGPRTLCNACGIRLHRRLNKTKMGTTPRRRKKVTRVHRASARGSFSIPFSEFLKREGASGRMDCDTLNNAHGTDVVYFNRRARRKTSVSPSSRRPSLSQTNGTTRVRSRRIAENALKKQASKLPRARSFRCEDFTAAIDLMSLSKARYRLIGRSLDKLQDHSGCLKSEVGVSDKDLLACSEALPQSSGPDFKRIQSDLVTAQWEVQAAEIGTQTVAEILAKCSEETARKRSRYWEARSELESFIMKHFKATAQP